MTESYNNLLKTGWQFADRNGELVVKICPYCHKQDKLYINKETGASHCKYAGCIANDGLHLTEILTAFGIKLDRQPNLSVQPAAIRKTYKYPLDKPNALTPQEKQWLSSRGFSDSTIGYSKIYHVNRNDGYTMAIPFYIDGKLILSKYRNINGGHVKEIASAECMQVLWNMDNCSPNTADPLVITEGMLDALSIIESGYTNVVSLPSGTGSTNCLDNCWEWIEQFEEYTIYTDNDKSGDEARSKLLTRLGVDKCRLITHPRGCKDANDVLLMHGKDKLLQTVKSAYFAPVKGIVQSELIQPEPELVETCDSLIYPIKAALNGYQAGALTLWTGDSGCGKTTILYNEMGCALRDGKKICIFSGEMALSVTKRWIYTPMAGAGGIDCIQQRFREDFCVKPEISNKLDRIYGSNFIIVDETYPSVETLLKRFEYAHKRYGSNIFVIDNLMVLNLSATGSKDINQDQTTAILKIADFCKNYNVHVHLVAHQNKSMLANSKNRVSGSKNLTNTSWNIIEVSRMSWQDKTKFYEDNNSSNEHEVEAERQTKIRTYTPDGTLNILKNRNYGDETKNIYIIFRPDTRRISWFPFGKSVDQVWKNNYSEFASMYCYDREMIKPFDQQLLEENKHEF